MHVRFGVLNYGLWPRLMEEKVSFHLAYLSSAQQQWDAFPAVFALKHAPVPLQGSAGYSFLNTTRTFNQVPS